MTDIPDSPDGFSDVVYSKPAEELAAENARWRAEKFGHLPTDDGEYRELVPLTPADVEKKRRAPGFFAWGNGDDVEPDPQEQLQPMSSAVNLRRPESSIPFGDKAFWNRKLRKLGNAATWGAAGLGLLAIGFDDTVNYVYKKGKLVWEHRPKTRNGWRVLGTVAVAGTLTVLAALGSGDSTNDGESSSMPSIVPSTANTNCGPGKTEVTIGDESGVIGGNETGDKIAATIDQEIEKKEIPARPLVTGPEITAWNSRLLSKAGKLKGWGNFGYQCVNDEPPAPVHH